VFPANALRDGYVSNTSDPAKKRIDERVHWSVVTKRHEQTAQPYLPPNLPHDSSPQETSEITKEEQTLIEACEQGRGQS
jgi:hypothetical protein